MQKAFSTVLPYIQRLLTWWGVQIRTSKGCMKWLVYGITFIVVCYPLSLCVLGVNRAGEAVGIIPTRTATASRTATLVPSATLPPTITPTIGPSATPEPTIPPPPTHTPAPGQSVEARAYFREISSTMGDMGKAISRIGELFQEPRLSDDNWRMDVAMQMGIIRGSHEAVQKIDPVPGEVQELHAAILDATTDCDGMTRSLAAGLDTLNAKKINEAVSLMESCGSKIQAAQPLMDKFTP